MDSHSKKMKVSWTEVASDPLLARTHHITVVWRDKLVVHGGLMSSKSPPLNSLATWSPTENSSKVQYESLSDVGVSRVWFASKNLTPCRMHLNDFLIAQIIAKCHSFPNMYDML